jgi:DNA-binding NarL/FixJ family response regulator
MNSSVQSIQSTAAGLLRILVADDHDLVRQGLRFVLGEQPGWIVCGEAATGLDAVRSAQELRPDVVVIDIHMPGMDGLQAAREIRTANPQTEVLILTIDEGQEVLRAATEAGARGIVMKSDAARHLVAAVDSLARHEVFYTPQASQKIAPELADPPGGSRPGLVASAGTLTNREREVVALVAEGHSNKQVAVALGICAKTVETHRANVMHKLGLKHTAELVRYAMRDGLIEP